MRWGGFFFIVGFVAILAGSGFFVAGNPESGVASLGFHRTAYRQDKAFIERHVAESRGFQAPPLYPMGGIVPHHVPVSIPLLADFYVRLSKARPDIETFVIFGPDHFEKGSGDVSISEASFETPFATLRPDSSLIKKIEDTNLVVHDEAPFNDHSIHSQLLLIGKLFPKAKIVAITFRSSSTNDFAQVLGERIASLSSEKTFFVASVDFTHYLHERQARPLDAQSASYLQTLDPHMAGLAEADSPQSLVAAISATVFRGANLTEPYGVYNSADFTGLHDNTTGYVIQMMGRHR